MEKPKNMYVQPKDMNFVWGVCWRVRGWCREERDKEEKTNWDNSNSIINKMYFKKQKTKTKSTLSSHISLS